MAAVHDERERGLNDASSCPDDAFGPSGALLMRGPHRRSGGVRRACLAFAAFLVSIVFVGLIGGGLFFARLSQGPINVDLASQVAAALNERVGAGYRFELGGTSVEGTEHGPALTLDRLAVTDAAHHPVITAPRAEIGLDPLALLAGDIKPRQLDIRDIDLRLLILADGQVAVSAGTGAAAVPLASAFVVPASGPNDRARPVGEASRMVPATDRAPTSSTLEDAPGTDPSNAALRALTAVLRSLVDATTTPGGALGTLDNVNVSGRLLLDDRTHGTTSAFNNTQLNYIKSEDGSAVLKVAADGPTGRWSIAARAYRGADRVKTLTVEVHDLSLDEITLAGGLRNLGFDFDMPVSGSASVRFGPSGDLSAATGRFALGSGYFKLDDPDHEPLLIDTVSGGFHYDPASRNVVIDATQLRAGDSEFLLSGEVDLPHAAGESIGIKLQSSGTFGTERPGEKPIKISHVGMAFRLNPGERRFVIDSVAVDGPDVSFQTAGEVRLQGDGVRLINTASVKHMPAPVLVRLWPSFIAAPVRAWFLTNLRGGMIESGHSAIDLTDKDLALIRIKRSVADDHLRVDYTVSDLSLRVMNGVPNLTGLDGTGVVTGDTSSFVVQRGEMQVSPGHKLTLVEGSKFEVPSTDPKPTPAVITAHVTGGMESAADILGRDALKPYANLPIDTAAVKGQIDARLNIALKLGDHVPADDAKVTATADVANFAADKLIGKEGLVDTTLQLVADKSGLHARGEGRMYGAPASVDVRKPSGNGASEAVINLVLDDAARSKAGLTLGKSLTGIVTAKISTSLAQGDKTKALVDLDFSKATIDGLLPGFSKAAGRPGKATLLVTQHEGANTVLDNIVFEAGGTSVRGSAELAPDGSFDSARLSQIRLSPGDDIKLDASQSGDALKLVARGANFDARPFLKWLTGSPTGSGSEGSGGGKNIDVELHSNVLTGQNSQAISNADVRFSRRGGQMRSLQLTGRFGRQPISITTVQQDGVPVLLVRSSDAGNSLAFMDLYRRMAGGRLEANLTMSPNRIDGYAKVYDFTVREDPSIKKLAQEGLATQSRLSDSAVTHLDASVVPFTKLEASFVRMGNRVSVRDGALYGPQVGATVSGTLDIGRDQLNLEGTFVPLYGVNNLFSQVPLFGPILGGGTREGLFGVNYRITGSTSSPVLNVNPLSAMAPGFLRKIFGAIDDADFGGINPRDQATGSVPAPGQEVQ